MKLMQKRSTFRVALLVIFYFIGTIIYINHVTRTDQVYYKCKIPTVLLKSFSSKYLVLSFPICRLI